MKQTSTSGSAVQIAGKFFDHYNAQDVPSMVAMFEPDGVVEYVPFALSGPVEEIGPGSWGVLINSFPDLRNKVNSMWQSSDGDFAFVDVNILGTQQQEAFGVPSKGKAYDLRHFFIFKLNARGKIAHVTSFWDNADWYSQLGKTQID